MTITLGLNLFHADSAACIFLDDELIFAIEEERLNRQKHWAGLPLASIRACLEFARVSFDNVDYIAVNFNRQAHLGRKLMYSLQNPHLILSNTSKLLNRRKQTGFIKDLEETFDSKFKGEVIYCEHHRAHQLSSLISPGIDEAALLSIDGFGDFTSTSISSIKNNKITEISKVFFPHSLGIFYQAITQMLGFNNYGDEYKMMGLSAYGTARFTQELEKTIAITGNGQFELNLRYFDHHKCGNPFEIVNGIPMVKRLFSRHLEALLVKQRCSNEPVEEIHKDIAASAQAVYEKIFFYLLDYAWQKTKLPSIFISGGCAMNSLANGKINENSNFETVVIPPSPGDSGGAVGAALHALSAKSSLKLKSSKLGTPYFGNLFKSADIKKTIARARNVFDYSEVVIVEHRSFEQTAIETAKLLAQGCVVGWFQGRSEWGPRALGNRSIIADPRNPEIKDLLNLKIKRREGFRPFAPSILAEHQSEWFENDAAVPYMSQVFNVKRDKRKEIPGVVHIDGTGRLQTVLEGMNKKYHRLISEFFKLTGVPLVLNTSFNENEPIVETPAQAFAVFERTKMDLLVIENTTFRRL